MTMQRSREGHPFQHHGGATLALGCSNNGFESRLALRLVKTAMRPTRLFAKKRTCRCELNEHRGIGERQPPRSSLPGNSTSAPKAPLRRSG